MCKSSRRRCQDEVTITCGETSHAHQPQQVATVSTVYTVSLATDLRTWRQEIEHEITACGLRRQMTCPLAGIIMSNTRRRYRSQMNDKRG